MGWVSPTLLEQHLEARQDVHRQFKRCFYVQLGYVWSTSYDVETFATEIQKMCGNKIKIWECTRRTQNNYVKTWIENWRTVRLKVRRRRKVKVERRKIHTWLEDLLEEETGSWARSQKRGGWVCRHNDEMRSKNNGWEDQTGITEVEWDSIRIFL